MRKLFLISLVLCGLLVWACRVETGGPEDPEPQKEDVVDDVCCFPGEMIVELSDELVAKVEADIASGHFLQTKSSEFNSVFAGIGATKVERLYEDGGKWEARHREAGLHKWYRIKFDPAMPQTKAVRSVDQIPGIVYAEPAPRIKPTAIFNDPGLAKQWHYINDGTYGERHKKGCDINVEPVWERYTGGSSSVIVAVQDGGIDPRHEDLAAVFIPGGPNGSKNFVRNNYEVVAHDHGTHVAGTIGAINNNGKGCCGIAGGRDGKGGVRLMSVQVFETGDDGKDMSGDFYNSMVWACDHGAVISQNSWGYTYDKEEQAARGGVGGMKGAIDYFIKYAGIDEYGRQVGPMKGGVVIFAAGNDAWPYGWPAQYEPVIAVGAVAPDFTRSYYSCYGDWVDIAAPGGSVQYNNGTIYSTVPNDKYGSMQGTSMACPHVSGVAALLVSYFGGPGFTNEMLKEKLLGGANSSALLRNSQIGPLVDAFGAFAFGKSQAPDAVESYEVTPRSNFINFDWASVNDSDDVAAYGYILLAARNRNELEMLNVRQIPATVYSSVVEAASPRVDVPMSGTILVPDFQTEYFTAIVAYDYGKNYSKMSEIKSVRTGANTPPVVQADVSGKLVVKAHETLGIDCTVSDPDGHDITVDFTPGSKAAESVNMGAEKYRLIITGKNADPGNYTASYLVTDAFGAKTEKDFEYEILENHPPQAVSNPDDLVFTAAGQKKTIEVDDYVYDPDGEQLTYSISTSPVGIVHLNPVGNVLNLTTLDFGLAHVIITGTDVKEKTATLELNVLVRDPDAQIDIYPSQVKDYLSISDGTSKELHIVIGNSAGVVLFDETVTGDAFEPARIDMRNWAPGRYAVKVTTEGKERSLTVVKL